MEFGFCPPLIWGRLSSWPRPLNPGKNLSFKVSSGFVIYWGSARSCGTADLGCWYESVGPINCGKFIEEVCTFSTLLPSFINRIPTQKFINRYPILILQIFNISANCLQIIFNFSMFLQILFNSPTCTNQNPTFYQQDLLWPAECKSNHFLEILLNNVSLREPKFL